MSCWGDTSCLYRKKITVDHTKVAGDLTDYPLLVKCTHSPLKTMGNNGHVVNSNGYDIVFYDEECNRLSHELVGYDGSTGGIVMYVKIPTLYSDHDTVLYMYYGSDDITEDRTTPDTWNDNYIMVQHCHQASRVDLLDSTSNDNDAMGEDATPTYEAPGKIHKAIDFSFVDAIYIKEDASLRPTNVTIETWIYPTDTVTQYPVHMPYDDGALWDAPWSGYGFLKLSNEKFYFHGNEDGTYRAITDNVIRGLNVWYHLVGVYDGSYFRLYVDGIETAIGSYPGVITYNGNPMLCFGVRSAHNKAEYWDGRVEEVRVSNTAKTTDYIETTYANENDPAGFMSIEGEEGIGFRVIGDSFDVEFSECNPSWGDGLDATINKRLDTFEFWSDNYTVHDDGIENQPLILRGIETATDGDMHFCTPWCAPLCADTWFYNKFKHIWLMQDRHEEVEITGLGDCFDSIYIIKDFTFKTIPRWGKHALQWQMTLEKVE